MCVLICDRVCVFVCLFDVTMHIARSDPLSVSCMMMRRYLENNQISSLEAGAFAGLGNLTFL